MTTETIEKIKTGFVIYLATTILGLAMALVAWNIDYAFGVPALLGTLLCYMAGLFGRPYPLGESHVSEERA